MIQRTRSDLLGVVVSLRDLSASIWLWKRHNGKWVAEKVIEIPAEAVDPEILPPIFTGFKAVPPLITDLNLFLDDKWLYVLLGYRRTQALRRLDA